MPPSKRRAPARPAAVSPWSPTRCASCRPRRTRPSARSTRASSRWPTSIETQFQDKLSHTNVEAEREALQSFAAQLNDLGESYQEMTAHEAAGAGRDARQQPANCRHVHGCAGQRAVPGRHAPADRAGDRRAGPARRPRRRCWPTGWIGSTTRIFELRPLSAASRRDLQQLRDELATRQPSQRPQGRRRRQQPQGGPKVELF